MTYHRIAGTLAFLGGLAGLVLLAAFQQTGWGQPGTIAYERYELLNRLMALALLLMAAGWWGLRQPGLAGAASLGLLGTLLMAGGTAAEFWLYTDLPYGGFNARGAAFTVTSLSGWLNYAAAIMMGVKLWRRGSGWALFFGLAPLLDIVAFFVAGVIFAAPTYLALVTGTFLWIGRSVADPAPPSEVQP